ncbi:PIR Superfamily Protein [Plasmodium ovale wallikeri]|uniref:PIR Superfamily Protein n=2 Tax=Plasmodium ovale TaxID=36330 RepID=A0A1A9AH90_PLAOA|nr:PIR Superfamily Protein [Plasmodium ovale wallikeri]SBT59259.1 PIR Superfamily Protein [Plasmodium ovale wallikeri]SBT72711.1 Plasmodium vivax Vir protein/Plasmodium variant antigen protein Cir/Yir/Bir, putative [Plasmodium ovale]
MCCAYDPYEEYEFFKHTGEYAEFEDSVERTEIEDKSTVNCNFITSMYKENVLEDNIPKVINVCKQFIYLTELLINRSKTDKYNADNDYNYLNYWLHDKINKIDSDNICKKSFFQNLVSHNNSNNKLSKLKGKIRDIEKNILDDMNILYILYKNYNEIDKILQGSNSNKENILEYAKNCAVEYEKVKDRCTDDGNKFCETLNTFKKKYEVIDLCNYNIKKWKKRTLPSLIGNHESLLPECSPTENLAQKEVSQKDEKMPQTFQGSPENNMKTITIGTVVTFGIFFIFFILFKFTSFGSCFLSRISKNENVRDHLDEEMNHLPYTSEYEHVNSGNTSYNIAFNSVV